MLQQTHRLARPFMKLRGKAHLYVQLASLPIPTAAQFISPDVIRVTSSTRDHSRNVKRSTSKTIFVSANTNTVSVSLPEEPGEVVSSALSPSGNLLAILREQAAVPSSNKNLKRYVEIWHGDVLQVSLEVTERHGSFYTDEFLSTLTFSPSETALLYSAEGNDPQLNNKCSETNSFERFQFQPSFGEGLSEKKRPTLFLFRWNTSSSEKLNSTSQASLTALSFSQPPSLPTYLAQALFASENVVIATGHEYTSDGRLLGVKYCYNRPIGLWELAIPNDDAATSALTACTATKLTPSHLSSRSPRRPQQGSTLFWIANKVGGPHASGVSLHSLDLHSKETRTLVDTIWEPTSSHHGDKFPGLYTDYALPSNPFLNLDSVTYIITHSIWHSRSTVLLVSSVDGCVRDLTPDDDGKMYSWTVLGTDGERQVVCSRSSFTTPHEVVLGMFEDSGSVQWTVISRPTPTTEVMHSLERLQVSIIAIPKHHPTETIVLRCKDMLNSPCVTTVHGGPHGTTTTAFSAATVALALQGYTIALPNYTGSLGFGEKFVRKLIGECGRLDVSDCMASVRHLIKLGISEEGLGKQFVQGGSHGGFLAAHLIGQFPNFFSAAVIRNPVISVGEISTSDLPDWYYEEFGIPFGHTTRMTPEIFDKLHALSPISHVDAVCTPVLLLVGDEDLRVAPTQATNYYHALKGRGKVVEMLRFPKDSHPLDSVEAAKVGWETGRDWMESFSKTTDSVSS